MKQSISIGLEAAAAELNAAQAIVSDPICDPQLAMEHLLRAWRHAAELPRSDESTMDDSQRVAQWLSTLEQMSPLARNAALAGHRALVMLASETSATTDKRTDKKNATRSSYRSTTLEQIRILQEVIERASRGHVGRENSWRARTWIKRALGWTAFGVGVFLLAVRPWEGRGAGPWRGAYYPSEDFKGDPTMRRDRDINFDWGLDAPMDDIPGDRFGVIWDSCLIVAQDQKVTFQLISDDGSRLHIENDIIVDNWGKRPRKSKGATTKLDKGIHHIRVEYFEWKSEAMVQLLASFDPNTPPSPIPATMLMYPLDEIDSAAPCEGSN